MVRNVSDRVVFLFDKWIGQVIVIFNFLLTSVSVLSENVNHSAVIVSIEVFEVCCLMKGLV